MIDMLSAHYSPIVAHHRNYLGKYLIDTKVICIGWSFENFGKDKIPAGKLRLLNHGGNLKVCLINILLRASVERS